MPSKSRNLLRRLTELQNRLVEAEDTLAAIRSGSIDALVVRTPRGEQLFTLKGADHTYRTLVEAMNEGALTLNGGTICYCNHHFAKMARAPLEKIMGTSIFEWVRAAELRQLVRALDKGSRERGSLEALLRTGDAQQVPVLLSASRFDADGKTAIGLAVTDITERKEVERARHELSRRILNAQELERQRVARDLHDGVNQLLSSAKYRLSNWCQQHTRHPHDDVRFALSLIEKAIAEVRLISRNLRPSELDDLGLVAALRSLACEFESQTGICTRFEGQSNGPLPSEVEMALYRIAQEALNNVANHSKAAEAEVTLFTTASHALLIVRDNGRGLRSRAASHQRHGWGLKNMKARAALLGGSFFIEACARGGTRVTASIPVSGGHPRKRSPAKSTSKTTAANNGNGDF